MGKVCAKHDEFYETECRWCEPEPEVAVSHPADMGNTAHVTQGPGLSAIIPRINLWAGQAQQNVGVANPLHAMPAQQPFHIWGVNSTACIKCGLDMMRLHAMATVPPCKGTP